MSQAQPKPDAPASPSPGGADRRRHKRRSGMWKAHVELGRGQRVDCVVLDLSDGGARLVLRQPIVAGKVVTLVAERAGTRGARVAWADGNRVGIEFIERSADVVGLPGAPFTASAHDNALSPPAPATPQPAGMNARFLRGRAQVLRELAENNPDPAKAATLLRAAEGLEVEASQIERQQHF